MAISLVKIRMTGNLIIAFENLVGKFWKLGFFVETIFGFDEDSLVVSVNRSFNHSHFLVELHGFLTILLVITFLIVMTFFWNLHNRNRKNWENIEKYFVYKPFDESKAKEMEDIIILPEEKKPKIKRISVLPVPNNIEQADDEEEYEKKVEIEIERKKHANDLKCMNYIKVYVYKGAISLHFFFISPILVYLFCSVRYQIFGDYLLTACELIAIITLNMF